MNVMKKIFLLLCLSSILWISCYDDKGNYDYHEINRIEGVTDGLDSIIYIRQFDTLRCTPAFAGTFYSNPEAYSYEWEIEQKIVSTELSLVYPVILSYGDKNCRLIITDKEQGNQYIFPFRLIVSGERAGDMIVVLSNTEGKAELSYKGLIPDTLPFVINYYERSTGLELGGKGHRLYRNYLPVEAYSGMMVSVDKGVKSLADTTLEDIGGNTYLDEAFLKRQIPYPEPSVPGFAPDFIWSGIINWDFIFGNRGGRGAKNIMISEGKLYSCQISHESVDYFARTWLLDKESKYGGKLSSVYFPVSAVHAPSNIIVVSLAYNYSDYGVVFDETVGRFLLVSNLGSSMVEIPKSKIPAYEGYRLIFGSYTNLPNICVAILANGENVKALELQLPTNINDVTECKVLAEMDMPQEMMNSRSDFYQYKSIENMLVSCGKKLLASNIREWENGTAPKPVFSLDNLGYGEAEITCFEMSRSEKSIILGISRYGDDHEGKGEKLKGDVIVLDAVTYTVKKDSKGREMIYRGVCGYPVDIMVKWQEWYRDGKNHNNQLMDSL